MNRHPIARACLLSFALGFASTAAAQPSLPLQSWPVGITTNRASILVDLDGDGRLDLAQTYLFEKQFIIARGDGFGGFLAPQIYQPSNQLTTGPVAVDIDEDGDLDLVAISGAGFLARLFSDGVGGFTLGSSLGLFPELNSPVRVLADDGDGDGHQDLIVVTASALVVLKGDGFGGFTVAASYAKPLGGSVSAVDAADLDHDGDLDVVTRESTTNISVYAGDGLGGFLAPISIPAGLNPTSVVVSDVDHDGDIDILTGTFLTGLPAGMTLIPNLGGLTFGAAQPVVAFGPSVTGLAAIDLDGNGFPEVIATRFNEVRVQADAFGPTPGPVELRPAGASDQTVLAARLDGDSFLDVVLTDSMQQSVAVVARGAPASVLDGNGPLDTGTSAFVAALTDVDQDNDDDALVVENITGIVRVYLNDGAGHFTAGAASAIGHKVAGTIGAADLDGDADIDLVVAAEPPSVTGPSHLTILRAQPGGTFVAEPPLSLPGLPRSIAFGRFNAHAALDFVVGDFDLAPANAGFHVFASSATGYVDTLVAQPAITVALIGDQPTNALATLDVDHDGFDDVAACVATGATHLHVFHCDGAGGFALSQALTGAVNSNGIAAADVDGDGFDDVVVGPTMLVHRGLANSLQTTAPTPVADVAKFSGRFDVFDVDRDGKDDLVLTGRGTNEPALGWRRAVGNLTFEPSRLLAAPTPMGTCVLGDVNRDARTDFVTSSGDISPVIAQTPGALYAALSGCEGRVGRYGNACPVASGSRPRIAVDGCVEPNHVATLRIDDAQGGGIALLAFGTTTAAIPLPNGCVLAVAPLLPAMIALPVAPSGSVAVPVVVRPSIAGLTFTAQALFPSGGASDAVEVHVGN